MMEEKIQFLERYENITGKNCRIEKIEKFLKDVEIFEKIVNIMDS